jgi:hypothetical protein
MGVRQLVDGIWEWDGKPKNSEKTYSSAAFSSTNPTWSDPGSNPGRLVGKPATNVLSYGMSPQFLTGSLNKRSNSRPYTIFCILNKNGHSESLGLWTLSIVRHSKKLKNIKFRKQDLFPSSSDEMETPTLLGYLERANFNHCIQSKGPNRLDNSLPSPEDGNRYSLRNVVFSSYLELRTMDKVHAPSDS